MVTRFYRLSAHALAIHSENYRASCSTDIFGGVTNLLMQLSSVVVARRRWAENEFFESIIVTFYTTVKMIWPANGLFGCHRAFRLLLPLRHRRQAFFGVLF